MRELVLLLLILVTIQVHANGTETKKRIKLTPPGQNAQTTEDPGSATHLLYQDPRNPNNVTANLAEEPGTGGAVKATCTDNMGMIYKKGDTGYDGCLRSFDRTQPKLPGDDKRPSSWGITVGK